MIEILEYLYKPFIETWFWIWNLLLLIWYKIRNKKITDSNRGQIKSFEYGQERLFESEIRSKRDYLLKNFPWVLKLIFLIIIFAVIYKIIVSVGLVEIIKLFL